MYTPVMAIPPRETAFVLTGYCTDKCTNLVSGARPAPAAPSPRLPGEVLGGGGEQGRAASWLWFPHPAALPQPSPDPCVQRRLSVGLPLQGQPGSHLVYTTCQPVLPRAAFETLLSFCE